MNQQTLKKPLTQLTVLGVITGALCISSARAAEPIRGFIGVGTWATQAEFKDIRVTQGDKTLYASDFSKGLNGWKPVRGKWEIVDGALRQTSDENDARAVFGDASWSNYTLTLRARKLGGSEGFFLSFGLPDETATSRWNVGGWNNTQHALQVPGVAASPVNGNIETNRWYDVKVELSGNSIKTYLDDRLIQSALQTPASRDFGRALVPDLVADPSIAEFDGTFYLYATTDGDGNGLATSGLPVVWQSKDFLNWSFKGSIFPPDFDAKYWAPSAPVFKDGRYYLFPTLDNRIAATVSDAPTGPFRALDGKNITRKNGWKTFPINVGHAIDADVFRDDDGSYYMVWSQRYIAKLNADFSGFEGAPVEIKTKRGGYSEGPALFKRDGIYYYLYTLGGSESYQYAYMMSRTGPLGPWEAPQNDIIATTDAGAGVYGPGHGCFFHPKGTDRWIFVYLEYGRSSTNRHILANEMRFNADGTIAPIQLSLDGVGALRADRDYAKPDLALGKSAVASSTRADVRIAPTNDQSLNRIEGFAPANALDGSNGSRWMARETDANARYNLDLGAVRDVARTELYFVQPTKGHAYRLDYSLDGQTWLRYGGHDDARVQSPHVDLKAVRARYLRVTITKGAPGLWEFRVY